jgi:hypothetical protein
MQELNELVVDSAEPQLTLTPSQEFAKSKFIEWFTNGEPDSPFAVLAGYAGTGKTTTVKFMVQSVVDQGLLDWGEVLVCAPTHTAVNLIKKAIGQPCLDFLTLHSFLGLRPRKIKLTVEQRNQLLELSQRADLSFEEEATRSALRCLEQQELEGKQVFAPSGKRYANLGQVRFILVDEASMVSSELLSQLVLLKDWIEVDVDLKILFLGDPAQLPPVKEKTSPIFKFPLLHELTQVMRYDGNILKYVTAVRTEPGYESLHYVYANESDILLMSWQDALEQSAECFSQGESLRILSATNRRVDEANTAIRRMLHPNRELFFQEGDILLTREAIQRGNQKEYGECSRDDFGNLLVGTSVEVRITQLTDAKEWGFEGKVWRRLHAKCVTLEGEPIDAPLLLLDPSQWLEWQEECKRLAEIARTTNSRSKKAGVRGQEGETAKLAWEWLGIKNWYSHLNGSPISESEYFRMKKDLWARRYYPLLKFADPVSFSYASTVHRAQGTGFDAIVLDMSTFRPRSYQQQGGEQEQEWDIRKLLYTALTRARDCVVIGV